MFLYVSEEVNKHFLIKSPSLVERLPEKILQLSSHEETKRGNVWPKSARFFIVTSVTAKKVLFLLAMMILLGK